MSRYLLLLILTLPVIAAGILNATVDYKMGKITAKRFGAQMTLWLLFLIGLIIAEPLYEWLFSNNLTQTEPLSLFDVAQITAIIILFYVANRFHSRINALETHLTNLHRELSIALSDIKDKRR